MGIVREPCNAWLAVQRHGRREVLRRGQRQRGNEQFRCPFHRKGRPLWLGKASFDQSYATCGSTSLLNSSDGASWWERDTSCGYCLLLPAKSWPESPGKHQGA